MPFKITVHNEVKDSTVELVQVFGTLEVAYRAAMAEVTSFIHAHWDVSPGNGNADGPQNNSRFKIYIERTPGKSEIELRYDYPIPGDQETNSIIWRIAEI